MVNKDLIRHILKEETRDTKSELIRQIKDEGLYSIAELVGGLDNLKKILKDNPEMVERIENQKGLVKVSWTTDGDDPSIVLPFKIIGAGWNRWMSNSWPIINISYNENTLTKDENHKFKDFLYDSFHDESSVRVVKLDSNEPRMHQNYVQLGEINGKTAQQPSNVSRSYDLSDIRDIVETLGDNNILKEETDRSDKTSNGMNLAVKILKKSYPYVKGWKYGDSGEDRYDIFINIICDIEKLKEFYNSNLIPYYIKNRDKLEGEDFAYAFSPLLINKGMNADEKFKEHRRLTQELNDIYEMMPESLIKRDLFNDPKSIQIDKFMFE